MSSGHPDLCKKVSVVSAVFSGTIGCLSQESDDPQSPEGNINRVKLWPHWVVCGSRLLSTSDSPTRGRVSGDDSMVIMTNILQAGFYSVFSPSGFKIFPWASENVVGPGHRACLGLMEKSALQGVLVKNPSESETQNHLQLSAFLENRLRWHHRVSGQRRSVWSLQWGWQDLPRGEGGLQPFAGDR